MGLGRPFHRNRLRRTSLAFGVDVLISTLQIGKFGKATFAAVEGSPRRSRAILGVLVGGLPYVDTTPAGARKQRRIPVTNGAAYEKAQRWVHIGAG